MHAVVHPHIKLIVFDFDDTLVGTRKNIWALHKHIANKFYGVELTDEDILPHWGKPMAELTRHYYHAEDTTLALERIREHGAQFPKEKYPETVGILQRLKAGGKLIGVVSATIRPIFEDDCAHVELPIEVFDYIQTSEDTPFHKPDKRVFTPLLRWADQKKIAPEEILYIGDGLHDMRAAQDAGFAFLGVTTGLVTAEEFQKHHVRAIPELGQLVS